MKILVLMSTYNGEAYVKEQLDSLCNQTVKVDILVRDDGSLDSTVAVLAGYGDRIKHYSGDNLGFCHSFLNLVKTASDDYDYYMFCDQDDVWLPEKAERAEEMLDEYPQDTPLLYMSNIIQVDADLSPVGKVSERHVQITPESALVKSYCNGCTMMFNRALKRLFEKLDYPKDMLCHDWMMSKIAALFGKIVYDKRAFILYRLHGNNAIGSRKSGLRSNMQRASKAKMSRAREARVIIDTYGDILDGDKLEKVKRIAEINRFGNRMRVAFSRAYTSHSFKTDMFIKLYALMGRL